MNIKVVDILIPTKDRAIQLHLLLESMGKHLKNMGRITITWQAEDENFRRAYQLLKSRVESDKNFEALRNNSEEIVWIERNELNEVYNATMQSGESDYILPIADDELYYRDYDLVNHPASIYMFEHDEVLGCALRLGDNLSCQVPHTQLDTNSVLEEETKGHGTAMLLCGKPRYLYPRFGHHIDVRTQCEYINAEYLVWNWLQNLESPGFSCICSVTSHIYRKTDYYEWLIMFGIDNFLLIEGKAKKYLLKKEIGFIYPLIHLLDRISYSFVKRKGIYYEEILQTLIAKFISLTKKKNQNHYVCPMNSVVWNAEFGSIHREINIDQTREMNEQYLDSFIIDCTNLLELSPMMEKHIIYEHTIVFKKY